MRPAKMRALMPPAAGRDAPETITRDSVHSGEEIELLRRIEQHLAALVAQGARAGAAGHVAIAEADREVLAAVLPILGQGLGPYGRLFTAAEALRAVQAEAEVDISVKALGKLFARCHDIPVNGFRVRKDGSERGTTTWRVWRV